MNYTSEDVKLLAKCGWLEARGEGIGAVYAVMHCVVNRLDSPDFPNTLNDIIFQKNAFSWTRLDNPEYGKEPPETDQVYIAALEDAEFVLAGDSDPTRGACYYANLATMGKGGWFEKHVSGPDGLGLPGHEFTVKIGKHSFYR